MLKMKIISENYDTVNLLTTFTFLLSIFTDQYNEDNHTSSCNMISGHFFIPVILFLGSEVIIKNYGEGS